MDLTLLVHWAKKIFDWLFAIWQAIPREKKEEIIEKIVKKFEDILGRFWEAWQKQ